MPDLLFAKGPNLVQKRAQKQPNQWCRRWGCRGCKRIPKSFDLLKIQAKFLEIWEKSLKIWEKSLKV